MTQTTPQPSTEATAGPIVEMRDINVAFGGVHAVREVTIDLHAGEVVGLVGGNGAGKSTLMRALSGAHPPDSGEILIDGEPRVIGNPRDAKVYNIEMDPHEDLVVGGVGRRAVVVLVIVALVDE